MEKLSRQLNPRNENRYNERDQISDHHYHHNTDNKNIHSNSNPIRTTATTEISTDATEIMTLLQVELDK